MVNVWSGAEALENAFRVADEELRKVERERDQAREQRDMWKLEHDRLIIHGSVRGDTYAAMVRDRDDWRDKAYSASEGMRKATARAEATERSRDALREAAEARTAPAVPLHQPDGTHMGASHLPIAPDDDPVIRHDLEALLAEWVTYETLTLPEVAERIMRLLASAWDRGHYAGEWDHASALTGTPRRPRTNPYEPEETT